MRNYFLYTVKLILNSIHKVPEEITKNFIEIDQEGYATLERSIRDNYHTGWRSEEQYDKKSYESDLQSHVKLRLQLDRMEIVPWLNDATKLRGKRVLEIGCGTGSSTVALAEQGAKVTGIDIDDGSLDVAQDRATLYGLDLEFYSMNAEQMQSHFQKDQFDLIIFFACLEHMTIEERISSLKAAWEMIPTGGFLVAVETPNRLWHFDSHTSKLPFYHWLPNELAFHYSKYSTRKNFREIYHDYNDLNKENFLRRGRGVSYHEFELAIDRVSSLNVISSLSSYQGYKYSLNKSAFDRKYKSFLSSHFPELHHGWFDEYLDLVIRKS